MSTSTLPTPEAIKSVTALYDAMRAKARPSVDKFEARYNAWKQTWAKSIDDSSPIDQVDEFAKLVDIGDKILPLIVYKLCTETEAPIVKLYNAIEKDANFESQLPTAIITSNQERNQNFTAYSADWARFKEENLFASLPGALKNCGAYWDLIELGPSIVPHVMLAYYDDLGGCWDMLLSELWPFHPIDPRTFDRTFNQKVWIDWFESEVGDCVP